MPDPLLTFSRSLDNVYGSEAVSRAKAGVTPRSFSTWKWGGINPLSFASNMFCNSHSDAIIAN